MPKVHGRKMLLVNSMYYIARRDEFSKKDTTALHQNMSRFNSFVCCLVAKCFICSCQVLFETVDEHVEAGHGEDCTWGGVYCVCCSFYEYCV